MRKPAAISILALAAAMATTIPAPAQSLDVGVSVGGDVGVDASVDTGAETSLDVDVDVGGGTETSGGETAVDVDANVDLGDSPAVDAGVNLGNGPAVDADVELLDGGAAVGADVNLGGAPAAPAAPAGDAGLTVDGTVRVAALGTEDARLDAVLQLLGNSGLAGVNLDAAVDDQRVIIVDIGGLLGADAVAEVEAAIEAGAAGRDETLAAIEASVELGQILEREGIAPEAVIAVQIGADGATEVLVNAGGAGDTRSAALAVDVDAAGENLAAAEASLALTNDAGAGETPAAAVDADARIALLEGETARLDALLSLAADTRTVSDISPDISGDQVAVVELGTILGEEAQAQVHLALANGPGRSSALARINASPELSGILENRGVGLAAVVALDVSPDGFVDVFVDGAGTMGATLAAAELAVDPAVVGAIGGVSVAEDGNGAGSPAVSGDDTAARGPGGGAGVDTGNPGAGDDADDVEADADLQVALAGTSGAKMEACGTGLAGLLSEGETISSEVVARADTVSVVVLTGCSTGELSGIKSSEAVSVQREVLAKDEQVQTAVAVQGFATTDILGGLVAGDDVVVYVTD